MKHNALYFFGVNDKMTFAGHLSWHTENVTQQTYTGREKVTLTDRTYYSFTELMLTHISQILKTEKNP